MTGSRLYRAYGTKRSGDDLAFERTYTGPRLDDTGLMYFRARTYDPSAGRLISSLVRSNLYAQHVWPATACANGSALFESGWLVQHKIAN